MADRTTYIGADSLEYLTQEDADKYGGGCVQKRTVKDPVIETMTPVDPATVTAATPIESVSAGSAETDAASTEDDPELTALRAEAKRLGVKGVHWTKNKELLRQRIAEAEKAG